MTDKQPQPAPEQDKDYQAQVRAEQAKECADKVKPPSGGKS